MLPKTSVSHGITNSHPGPAAYREPEYTSMVGISGGMNKGVCSLCPLTFHTALALESTSALVTTTNSHMSLSYAHTIASTSCMVAHLILITTLEGIGTIIIHSHSTDEETEA